MLITFHRLRASRKFPRKRHPHLLRLQLLKERRFRLPSDPDPNTSKRCTLRLATVYSIIQRHEDQKNGSIMYLRQRTQVKSPKMLPSWLTHLTTNLFPWKKLKIDQIGQNGKKLWMPK